MIRAFLGAVALACTLAGVALAASDEDTLVIEVVGEANGVIEIELMGDVAPAHVAQIKALARAGRYDNVVFHRVIDGFMAQTGDVQYGVAGGPDIAYAGFGGSDLPDLPAEFSDIAYTPGIVGMARSQDPNSANSQFFIMFAEAPFLNGKYTVVGRVTRGQEVVDTIRRGDPNDNGKVENPDVMRKVTVKADMN